MVMNIQSNSLNKNMSLKNHKNIGFSGNSPDRDSKSKVQTGAVLGTVSGIALALALLMKKQGNSLNPSKLLKSFWKTKFKEKEILTIAGGSILGGFAGGAISDKKENLNAKIREAVIQVANVSVPLVFVSLGAKILNKNGEKIEKCLPKINSSSEAAKFINKGFKASPIIAMTAVCLGVGVFCANKAGNLINEKIFNIRRHRRIKAADFSPHVDDVCLGISLMASKDIIGHSISRFIPAALTVAGVSIGTAQEKGNMHQQRAQKGSDKIVKG